MKLVIHHLYGNVVFFRINHGVGWEEEIIPLLGYKWGRIANKSSPFLGVLSKEGHEAPVNPPPRTARIKCSVVLSFKISLVHSFILILFLS